MANNDKKVIELAQKRYARGVDYLQHNWNQMERDLRFGQGGKQWPTNILKQRKADGRPCLTINRIPSFIRQVVGSQRQFRPSIKVRPVDSFSDPEQAEIRQDIIRHIEYNSKAKSAYDHGFTGAVSGGMGYWKITTEYAEGQTFDQDILIQRIFNPFSVVLDPDATELDRSDSKWGFVHEWLNRDEFKKKYNKEPIPFSGDERELVSHWIREDSVMVAEYYTREEETETIHLTEDGQIVNQEELDEQGLISVKEREAITYKVVYRLIDGEEVLEEKEWAGSYIPVIPTYGEEIFEEGRAQYNSLIRWAKDAQRMYNYWSSTDTEFIALQPKAPFLVTAEQIKGHETMWAAANTKNFAYLLYNYDSNAPSAPIRQMPPQLSTAIGTAAMRSVDDMKATMGLFDPSLGEKSNRADSGKAITALQRQGETSTYVWIDNLSTAINHTGRILLELIPKIYDAPRVFRIRGEDGTDKEFAVNTLQPGDSGQEVMVNDLSVGKYDVVIETGPSYATKRIEAVEGMDKMIAAYPQIMEIAGDLFAKNMDWPGADDISERIRKTLPPGLVEPEEDEEPPAPPEPTPQDQLEAQKLELEAGKLELEAEKLEVEKMKVEVDAAKVEVDAMNDQEDMEEKMRRIAMDVVAEVHGGGGGTLD